MTPRALDWRSVEPKLRKIGELLTHLTRDGRSDAGRVDLAVEGYGEYVRQVAAWFVARGDAR